MVQNTEKVYIWPVAWIFALLAIFGILWPFNGIWAGIFLAAVIENAPKEEEPLNFLEFIGVIIFFLTVIPEIPLIILNPIFNLVTWGLGYLLFLIIRPLDEAGDPITDFSVEQDS